MNKIQRPEEPNIIKHSMLQYLLDSKIPEFFRYTETSMYKNLSIHSKWEIMWVNARACYDLIKSKHTELPICTLAAFEVDCIKKLCTFEHTGRGQNKFEMALHPNYRDRYWNNMESVRTLFNYATIGLTATKKQNKELSKGIKTSGGIKKIIIPTNELYSDIKLVYKESGGFYRPSFDVTDMLPEQLKKDLNEYDRLPEKELNWWI